MSGMMRHLINPFHYSLWLLCVLFEYHSPVPMRPERCDNRSPSSSTPPPLLRSGGLLQGSLQ
jgi:hypothetical protein